jgi:hypothetical protein
VSSFSVLSELSGEEQARLFRLLEEEVPYVRCKRVDYLLLRYIVDAIDSGEMLPVIIYGRRGGGKSTYALKLAAQYQLQYMNRDCGEAYRHALEEWLIHTPEEFSRAVTSWKPMVVWDDAGVWLSTYFWYLPEMRPYLIWFLNWYDTSRTDIGALLFTTVSVRKLPPRVRDDVEVVRARIRRIGRGQRAKVAKAHVIVYDESDYTGKPYIADEFYDTFEVFLPDPVYRAYKIIRDGYHRLAKKLLGRVLAEKGMYIPELENEEQATIMPREGEGSP